MVITIIIVAVVVVAAVAVVVGLRRRRVDSGDSSTGSRAPRPEPAPMRGLEDALNQVTDRSGTTMAARLDAEEAHVDDLRDVDDTGPLLRRALDHVTPRESLGESAGESPGESVGENGSGATAGAATESADELASSDEPGRTDPETPTS